MRNLPAFDARLSGVVFNYHYFTAVFWAAINYITKIELFDIALKYYQIGNILLICGSVYLLGMTVFKKIKHTIVFMWIYFFTACASIISPLLISCDSLIEIFPCCFEGVCKITGFSGIKPFTSPSRM